MTISDADISGALAAYLEQYQDEADGLSEPLRLLATGSNFASRRSFPMHVTVGALLVRAGTEILLIEHLAYGGLILQPGGHLESTDTTLIDAALRELSEETGIDPHDVLSASSTPAYVEYGKVPARPKKNEPPHWHLDIGYSFTADRAEIGCIQESEVTGAGWYQMEEAERLVGPRIARAVRTPAQAG